MECHLEMRREKQGSSLFVAGTSVFLLSGDGYVGELLELHQGCQETFLRLNREGEISLEIQIQLIPQN